MTSQAIASDLRAVSHRLVRRLNGTATADGLAPAQRSMLAHLDLAGELTSADLARREVVTPQAANLAVTDLLRRGLVTRRTDPDDGRRRLLSLTGAGRDLIHAVREDKNTWLARRIEAELTADEQRLLGQAVALLERLVATP